MDNDNYDKTKYVKIEENILSRFIKDDLIVVNTKTGDYFTFNETAKYIWKLIQDNELLENIPKQISRCFNVNYNKAKEETSFFINELFKYRIINKVY